MKKYGISLNFINYSRIKLIEYKCERVLYNSIAYIEKPCTIRTSAYKIYGLWSKILQKVALSKDDIFLIIIRGGRFYTFSECGGGGGVD